MKSNLPRKPQITFQVSPRLKAAHQGSGVRYGLKMTRLCAAGLLYLMENPELRFKALARLSDFENGVKSPPVAIGDPFKE